MAPRATILIPTMAGRGPVLPISVGSVLRQTVRDLEVFIIGDGVCDETRAVIRELESKDDRIRFFDYPEHPRRGEPNRHEVLSEEARGEIICYMCDRDLYLPTHVECMLELLEDADFAHTLSFDIFPDERFRFKTEMDIARSDDRAWILDGWTAGNGIPLSIAAHTLDVYRQLPHGWRETPPGLYTDIYMWEQILAEPSCRAVSDYRPTVLYFPSYPRRDWSIDDRREELERWTARMADEAWTGQFLCKVIDALGRDRVRLARNQRGWTSGLKILADAVGIRKPLRRIARRLPF